MLVMVTGGIFFAPQVTKEILILALVTDDLIDFPEFLLNRSDRRNID